MALKKHEAAYLKEKQLNHHDEASLRRFNDLIQAESPNPKVEDGKRQPTPTLDFIICLLSDYLTGLATRRESLLIT
jgi:hypothetical protein